jgi:hypothetical protein
MKAMTEQELKAILAQLGEVCAEAKRGDEHARNLLEALQPVLDAVYKELGIGADGALAPGSWEAVSPAQQIAMIGRLEGVLRALRASMAGVDEPKSEKNFMYRAHATNGWIYGLVAASIVVVALILWGVYRYWTGATSAQAVEKDMLRMVILMGALGGTVHWMSSLVNYIGNGNFMRRWIPYYLLAPFQGAALALLVYLLLRVGVLAAPDENGSAAQHLNLLGLYAFAGLTGLFAKQAIEMLRDVFNAMFKRIDAKDSSGGVRAPAPAAKPPEGAATR